MSAAIPIPPEAAQSDSAPLPFRALEIRAYCRHCGREITVQRHDEFGACSRCSSGPGWASEED